MAELVKHDKLNTCGPQPVGSEFLRMSAATRNPESFVKMIQQSGELARVQPQRRALPPTFLVKPGPF
jgi:hypothetical protein